MKLGNTIIEEPNTCPHCHVINEPEFKGHYLTADIDGNRQYLTVWRCVNKDCGRNFPALFSLDGSFERYLNGLPVGPIWPKPILNLKSRNKKDLEQNRPTRFIETYLQSLIAEAEGLSEIAGMGFRKAIEYLVKDWAIQSKPEDTEKINELWLGVVISEYYAGDLKGILERAAWLGNDQAHYNKLFEEYDIDILKELISLIMVELDRQFKFKHFNETIQKRK